jgi:hypothetical protein
VRATWPICQIRRIRGKSLFPASRLPKWDRSPFTRKIRFVFGAHVSVCRDNGCDKRYSLVSVWCLDISFHSSLDSFSFAPLSKIFDYCWVYYFLYRGYGFVSIA